MFRNSTHGQTDIQHSKISPRRNFFFSFLFFSSDLRLNGMGCHLMKDAKTRHSLVRLWETHTCANTADRSGIFVTEQNISSTQEVTFKINHEKGTDQSANIFLLCHNEAVRKELFSVSQLLSDLSAPEHQRNIYPCRTSKVLHLVLLWYSVALSQSIQMTFLIFMQSFSKKKKKKKKKLSVFLEWFLSEARLLLNFVVVCWWQTARGW